MTRSSPGRGWIILGIILVLVSIGFVAIGVAWSFSRFDLRQVAMPGSHEFQMEESGTIYIAYEPVSSFEGEFVASPETATMTLRLRSVPDGEEMAIERNSMVEARYSMGTRRGFYIGSASLTPGMWQLIGTSGKDTTGREIFAFGRASVDSIVMPIIVAGISGALVGPLGLGCLVVGITKRLKNRSQGNTTASDGST